MKTLEEALKAIGAQPRFIQVNVPSGRQLPLKERVVSSATYIGPDQKGFVISGQRIA